jgi:hypothetical protein
MLTALHFRHNVVFSGILPPYTSLFRKVTGGRRIGTVYSTGPVRFIETTILHSYAPSYTDSTRHVLEYAQRANTLPDYYKSNYIARMQYRAFSPRVSYAGRAALGRTLKVADQYESAGKESVVLPHCPHRLSGMQTGIRPADSHLCGDEKG